MKKFLIAYFSGTGSVKRVVNIFNDELNTRNIDVKIVNLDIPVYKKENYNMNELLNWCDFFLLAYPVHAFDAPKLVNDWIKTLPEKNIKTGIISVSGGGEGWPNNGTRFDVCKKLSKKGYDITYEKMMIMPCNWVFNTKEEVAMWLLKTLPEKVSMIIESILSGKFLRTKKGKGLFQLIISKLEKRGVSDFGKVVEINSNCNLCGWCAKNCPTENITIENEKPIFHKNCIMCFRCIYGCPSKAMSSKNFMVLKTGFNLDEFENKMNDTELPSIEESAKGLMWVGVKNYLLNKEKI